jgi:HAD superfamily hydrolase (TIGR01549 family)
MKNVPEAILFDLDGVLVDSLDAWWYALNDSLMKYKYSPISKRKFRENYWGHDLFDNLKIMGISSYVGNYCNKIYGNYLNHIKMFSDVRFTIEKLDSFRKCIITNTPKKHTYEILNYFSLKCFFEYIVTSSDVINAKPDPEIIFKACKFLEVKPINVVLVGDTLSDVRAGRKAGCTVIGIGVDADIRIKKISDLLSLLKL